MPEILEKVQKAAKKISNGFSHEGDEPILFYTDEEALKAFDRDMKPVIDTGNVFLRSYHGRTGFDIQSIEALNDFGKDPETFYKNQFYQVNEKDFIHLTKLKLDFASMITLPENFNEVVRDWNRFNRYFQGKGLKFFTIESGRVELTPAAYEHRDRHAYFKATTPEEKERLKISLDIIAAMEQLEPLVKREKNMQTAIDHKLFFHPMPYQIQRIQTPEGYRIIPCIRWIKEGWGGTSFLGRSLPTAAEKRQAQRDAMPRLGEKLIKFTRTFVTGETKDFLCKPEDVSKYTVPSDKIYEGFYNELGDVYGTRLDLTKPRTVAVTSWHPINSKK